METSLFTTLYTVMLLHSLPTLQTCISLAGAHRIQNFAVFSNPVYWRICIHFNFPMYKSLTYYIVYFYSIYHDICTLSINILVILSLSFQTT